MRALLSVMTAAAAIAAAYIADPPVSPHRVAARLVSEIASRYPVVVEARMVTDTGSFVVYSMIADYSRLDVSDPEAYQEGVARFTGDRNEAAVVLLKRTVEEIPAARLVGVYEDSFDVRAWQRDQILVLGAPRSYRGHDAFRRLAEQAFRYNFNMMSLPFVGADQSR